MSGRRLQTGRSLTTGVDPSPPLVRFHESFLGKGGGGGLKGWGEGRGYTWDFYTRSSSSRMPKVCLETEKRVLFGGGGGGNAAGSAVWGGPARRHPLCLREARVGLFLFVEHASRGYRRAPPSELTAKKMGSREEGEEEGRRQDRRPCRAAWPPAEEAAGREYNRLLSLFSAFSWMKIVASGRGARRGGVFLFFSQAAWRGVAWRVSCLRLCTTASPGAKRRAGRRHFRAAWRCLYSGERALS